MAKGLQQHCLVALLSIVCCCWSLGCEPSVPPGGWTIGISEISTPRFGYTYTVLRQEKDVASCQAASDEFLHGLQKTCRECARTSQKCVGESELGTMSRNVLAGEVISESYVRWKGGRVAAIVRFPSAEAGFAGCQQMAKALDGTCIQGSRR